MGQEQSAEKQAEELQVAAWTGDVRKVKSLLERGANPNHPKYYPLHYACRIGHLEIVKAVAEAGADPERRDDDGRYPVRCAAKWGHKEVLVYLIRDCKCNANARDNYENTPLHYACCCGHQGVVQYLVEEAHCDINVRNKNNQTVLHAACGLLSGMTWTLSGQFAVVQYLVEKANCDINATDKRGRTPLDLAKNIDYKDVVNYLKTRQESSRQPGKDGVGSQTAVPLTQDEADALQKLLEGAQVTIGHPIVAGTTTLEDVQQLLTQRGPEIMADDLRTRLRLIMTEQQRNLEILNNLMTDEDTIDVCYPRLFLVGPPSVGKTTTLNRLLGEFKNIDSAGDKAKLRSTLLANCKQILAFVNENTAKWLSSKDSDEETKLLFGYLRESKSERTPNKEISIATSTDSPVLIRKQRTRSKNATKQENRPPLHQATAAQSTTMSHPRSKLLPIKSKLQQLIRNADYSKMADFLGDILLNIHDIGGQPGFLEMLPALSTGPAMYLVFLDLSKELDKLYKIPFSRDGMEIIPFNSVHTAEATISQILTSIASVHCISRDPTPLINVGRASDALKERITTFKQVKPVAALIGTHKDKLTDPARQIREKNEALEKVVQKFPEIIISPGSEQQNIEHSEPLDGACTQSDSKSCFFSVDNLNGTEVSDIGPVRNFLSRTILARFKKASLPIRPKWLIFGLLLRKQFHIATIEDCFELGEMLEMQKEEVKVCLWYLHNCVGTILHYTNVPGDDGWLKGHVICTLQAIFDSISQFILFSMRTLHSGGPVTNHEQAELVKKGQFSIKSIEMCCRNVEIFELIPAKHLIKLLEHVKLLSPISHMDETSAEVVRTTYLMPAVLECASQEELANPPPPDTNNPEPLHITFSFGYVPTGVFCGLITRLVSQGPHGILGLKWKLVEDGVKRNCVSFYVDGVHKVTLLSHEKSYEIRVSREDPESSLHDLCAHAISVVLYFLKTLYENLVPLIAFQCPCSNHKAKRDVTNLCTISDGSKVRFICNDSMKLVKLKPEQRIWLGKTKKVGEEAELEVLKFAEDGFFFHWTKEGSRRQIKTTDDRPNTLSFQSVREEDFGHYQCEVKDAAAGKVLLTLYTALYKEETTEFSTEKNEEPRSSGTNSIVKTPSSDEGSLSSESLQYSADPVQRVGTPSAGEDNQVRTRRESPANRATLQGLINHYNLIDEQLNSEIKKADTPFIAKYLDNVELYSSAMGLTPAEEADVKESRGNQVAMIKCLQIWKERDPSQATYRALLDIALSLGKGDTADQICQQMIQLGTPLSSSAGGDSQVRTQKDHIGESVVEVTNKSKKFSNFGIKISVPENSLPEGIDMCVLHITFELSTDFEIPANSELVSSIYHVKCEPKVQFKKPLTLEIQHCVSLNSDYEQRLVFARATDESKKFEILEGGHFPIGECYGSIQLTRFSRFGAFFRKLRGIPNERMYSALLFSRKTLPVIDIKCVICWDLQTHVEVIRRQLEEDGFRKEMDRGQFQFDNEILLEMKHQPGLEIIIPIQPSSTLSKESIEGYFKVLFSNDRHGSIPDIHYTINLTEKKSFLITFLLKNTNLDENSRCLSIYIPLLQPLGNKSTETATQGDERSLSSERLQYSAAPVQRVSPLSSAGEDNQVRNRGSSANRVTRLQELMRQYNLTDEQLNSEIRNFNFSYLAIYFDDVELYSNALRLAPAEQADLNMLYYSKGTQAAMIKCLKIWKEHNSSQATYRALLDITLSLGKRDTADKICHELSQHRTLD